MTTGLLGKVMTYDGENRPLSVTYNGRTTEYVYGADGGRLMKTERTESPGQTSTTVYFGATEIRNYGDNDEEILSYPTGDLRLTNGDDPLEGGRADYLHTDQLGSVIGISDATGAEAKRQTCKPFGSEGRVDQAANFGEDETKTFLGERYDADSGLQYLNARYYDPELALFIQPDWYEVTDPGVGRNRYAYSHNDPVNKMDLGGNQVPDEFMEQEQEQDEIAEGELINDPDTSAKLELDILEAQATRAREELQELMNGSIALGYGALAEAQQRLDQANSKVKNFGNRKSQGVARGALPAAPRKPVSGVRSNQMKGAEFEALTAAKLAAQGETNIVRELTVKTQSGTKTRLDIVSRNSNGSIVCTECKSSLTAPLTRNQRKAFPEIETGGATVVGKGKLGYLGGSQIPKTTDRIIRP